MPLTQQDKKAIRGIIQDEIIDVVAEVVQPGFDRLGKKIDILTQDLSDFKQETKSNFMDVRRQISDLKIDTPTKTEFVGHEKRIHRLEKHLSFAW